MDRQRPRSGKNLQGHVVDQMVPPFDGMRTIQQQIPPSVFPGNISLGSDSQYPINGTYYGNPHSPTMMSPPPGFSVQNVGGMVHPGYQQQHNMAMFNNHLPPQQSSPNFYPGGFQQQQIPMFNNNYGSNSSEGMMHPCVGNQDYFSPTLTNENFFNNNVSIPRDKQANGVRTEFSPSKTAYSEKLKEKPSTDGITPLIDNIVGSMMSSGTYTHFGPTGGITAIPSNFTKLEPGRQADFGISLTSHDTVKVANTTPGTSKQGCKEEIRKESPVMGNSLANHISGRASTPNDVLENISRSRPQTPNKPSYSEILAKSASQNGSVPVTTPASTSRKAAANNSQSSKNSGNDNGNTASKVHRKSDNTSSGSSANSSSCTSLSSSPVAKPKTLSQTIMGRLFTTSSMGKENSSSATSRTFSRTPSTTPTHQKKNISVKVTGMKSEDRKILSSQNSENCKQKSKARLSKSSSSSGVTGSSDLSVDDLPAVNENLDGWKTCSRKHVNRINSAPFTSSNVTKHEISESTADELKSENHQEEESSETTSNCDDVNESTTDVGEARRESLTEKRSSASTNSGSGPSVIGAHRKVKSEKDRSKNKKDVRNCTVQRIQKIVYLWAATLISAAAWLLKLVTDVLTLSISVGSTLMQDFYAWWVNKAVPTFFQKFQVMEEAVRKSSRKVRQSFTWRIWPFRRKIDDENTETKRNAEDLLAALGPDKNIQISNADETLKRLLGCKGQDPYTILGVRSDSSDETIRRYYKRQAVQVHPDKNLVVGAEEAFKILGRAFEMIGEPSKRVEYHNKLLEAHAKEQVYGEIGKLLEQLRKKMEIATSSIRCTKCNLRHKKNKTDRPLFAARYCSQCNIHHAAREGELWAETTGWFGWSWNYFTCMDCHIWEINEWAKCQKKNLLHIKADSHCVMYRLVAGGQHGQSGQQAPGAAGQGQEGQFSNPDDDWDSLINNFCKTGGVPGTKGGDHFYQQGAGSSGNFYSGTGNNSSTSNSAAPGRKRKGKRK